MGAVSQAFMAIMHLGLFSLEFRSKIDRTTFFEYPI